MDSLLLVTIISAIAGIVGTGIGGVFAAAVNCKNNVVLAFMMQFAGGLMIGVVSFDLLPEAFEHSTIYTVLFGVVVGVLIAFIIDALMVGSKATGLVRTGILSAIAIAAHNFFEGLAIGSGFSVPGTVGISLAAVIMLHNIPEGISMSAPMIGGGVKPSKAIAVTALSGVPMAIGGFTGKMLGTINPDVVGACLGVAGGTMITISFCDLIPDANKISKGKLTQVGAVIGMILGVIIVNMNFGA